MKSVCSEVLVKTSIGTSKCLMIYSSSDFFGKGSFKKLREWQKSLCKEVKKNLMKKRKWQSNYFSYDH